MTTQWGLLGPVFALECRTAARRWQTYALRAFAVVVLLTVFLVEWLNGQPPAVRPGAAPPPSYRLQARVGEAFFTSGISAQILLVSLVAPALAAGAVCQDRANGNLLQLLATDLTTAEVVVGKFAARLLPVAGLVATMLPVLAISTLLGGAEPRELLDVAAVIVGWGTFGCSVALLLSVYLRKTHEVLLATYLIGFLILNVRDFWSAIFEPFLLTGADDNWLCKLNPFHLLLMPHYQRFDIIEPGDAGRFLAGTLAVSAVLVAVAIGRLRAVAANEGQRVHRPVRRWWDARLRERDPLLWYERHKWRPDGGARAVLVAYGLLTAVCGGLVIGGRLGGVFSNRGFQTDNLMSVLACAGLLGASVAAATSLAAERAAGGLDVLLATPLSTGAIVNAQWRAALGRLPWLLALPVLLALAVAWRRDDYGWVLPTLALTAAIGAAAVAIGLTLATRVRRPGLAAALAAVIGVFFNDGYPFFTRNLYDAFGDGPGLLLASPTYGVSFLLYVQQVPLDSPRYAATDQYDALAYAVLRWSLIWAAVFAGLAVGLYLFTRLTFDRTVGRMPERRASGKRERPEGDKSPVAHAPRAPLNKVVNRP